MKYQLLPNQINIETYKSRLFQGLAQGLTLSEAVSVAAFEDSLGQLPTVGERFFNSETNRIMAWNGTEWVTVGGN